MILQAAWNGIMAAGKPRASGDDPICREEALERLL